MQFLFSAGGLVYKRDPELKFLLIKNKNLKEEPVWRIPKGTIEKGEKVEEAAVREVEEETGVKVELGPKLQEIEFFYKRLGVLNKKKVYFLLMKYIGGEPRPQPGEVDEVAWFSPEEAKVALTYDTEKTIVDKALEAMHHA